MSKKSHILTACFVVPLCALPLWGQRVEGRSLDVQKSKKRVAQHLILLEQLRDEDPQIRGRAFEIVSGLPSLEDDLSRGLLDIVEGGEPQSAGKAIRALIATRPYLFLRNAQRCVENKCVQLRIQLILDRIGRGFRDYVGPRRFPPLTIGGRITSPLHLSRQRDESLLMLLGCFYPIQLDMIAGGLDDELPEIRRISCEIAVSWGTHAKSLASKLFALSQDEDSDVRSAALRALVRMRATPKKLLPLCLEALDQVSYEAPARKPRTWFTVADILKWAESAGPPGLVVLRKAIESNDLRLRIAALRHLRGQGDAAIPLLPRILELGSELRDPGFDSQVLLFLGEVGIAKGAPGADGIAPLLRRRMPTMAWETLKALENHPAWTFELCDLPLSMLEDSVVHYKALALLTLSKADKLPASAHTVIFSWLARGRDSRYEVRCSAVRALGKIEGDPKQVAKSLLACLVLRDVGPEAARVLGDLGRAGDRQLRDWIFDKLKEKSQQVSSESLAKAIGTGLGACGERGQIFVFEFMRKSGSKRLNKLMARHALLEMGRRSLDRLRQALRSEDRGIRSCALTACRLLGPDAQALVPDLIKLAREDAGSFLSAVRALGVIKTTPAIRFLRSCLRDEDRQRRSHALEVLGRVGAKALPALFEATGSKDEWTRELALEVIMMMKHGPESVPMIVSLLRTPSLEGYHRQPQLESLYRTGTLGREALHSLDFPRFELWSWISRFSPQDSPELKLKSCRWMAESAAEWHSVPGAFLSLVHASQPELRVWCARALGLFSQAKGWRLQESVIRLLGMQHDWDAKVRLETLRSLRRLGDSSEKTLAAFIQALGDRSSDVACEAARALGTLGPKAKRAVPALQETLKSQRAALQRAAALALGQIRP